MILTSLSRTDWTRVLALTLMQLFAVHFTCLEFVAIRAFRFGDATRPTQLEVRALVFPLVIGVSLLLAMLERRIRRRLLGYYTILFVTAALVAAFYIIWSAPFATIGSQ